ncbi:MAG: GGDEF domain-containing protein [Motiliproteus sp.]|nr:GGDEF domain-containing protein [Motiliproteus sp.]MCW9053446.1 GGDEF domain-containing protein [Motiliproteus sp.]
MNLQSLLETLVIPPFLKQITAVVVLIADTDGNVRDSNRGFRYLLGKEQSDTDLGNVRTMFLQPTLADLSASTEQTFPDPCYQGILNIGDHNGYHSVIGSVFQQGDLLLIIAEHNVSDLENLNAMVIDLNNEMADMQRELVRKNRALARSEEKYKQLMLTDSLTGLANRRHLKQRADADIERCSRYQEPMCLAIADIDHFKLINDSYGHDIGDLVLCTFAETVRQNIRKSDFVARVGGEEFAILLIKVSLEQAHEIIDNIRTKIAHHHIDSINQSITASFGITEFKPGDQLDQLMKRADTALYVAKRKGRNQVA